jgi:predicted DNA-binding transcriptional regulator AlpA
VRQAKGASSEASRVGTADDGSATYWDINDIQFHCRIGRTTAWKLVKRFDFPAPVVLGPKSLVWPSRDVVAYMESHRAPSHYGPDERLVAERPSSVTYTLRPVSRR